MDLQERCSQILDKAEARPSEQTEARMEVVNKLKIIWTTLLSKLEYKGCPFYWVEAFGINHCGKPFLTVDDYGCITDIPQVLAPGLFDKSVKGSMYGWDTLMNKIDIAVQEGSFTLTRQQPPEGEIKHAL